MPASTPITYVELAASDLAATKTFYTTVFNWQFEDYGPEYVTFKNAGISGGFYKSDKHSQANNGATLVVMHTNDLDACQASVEKNGGTIKTKPFSFPGGRRFHFLDPCQNELAVWASE